MPSPSDTLLEVLEPATSAVLESVPRAGMEDVDAGAAVTIKRVTLELGPVAVVIGFDDEEEAIRLANDTIYGLSASVWSRDGGRALRVARALEAGSILYATS